MFDENESINFGKSLILSPHMDDEILGCGGTLSYMFQPHVHYFNKHHTDVDILTYFAENRKVRGAAEFVASFADKYAVNKLESFPIDYHISEIEKLINNIHPNTVFIPTASYNQDHRRIYEATLTALRVHDKNWYVRNIMLYEQPETVQSMRSELNFRPNVFVPIDIDAKLYLYHLYRSQVRKHRSDHYVKSLAGMRGMQCNEPYAEAFMALRITK